MTSVWLLNITVGLQRQIIGKACITVTNQSTEVSNFFSFLSSVIRRGMVCQSVTRHRWTTTVSSMPLMRGLRRLQKKTSTSRKRQDFSLLESVLFYWESCNKSLFHFSRPLWRNCFISVLFQLYFNCVESLILKWRGVPLRHPNTSGTHWWHGSWMTICSSRFCGTRITFSILCC